MWQMKKCSQKNYHTDIMHVYYYTTPRESEVQIKIHTVIKESYAFRLRQQTRARHMHFE